MKLPKRNAIYFIILILLCLVPFWYFYRCQEPLENLDEMVEGGNSCDGPFGCKTTEEIKKETKANLKTENERISRPASSLPVIVSNNLQLTLTNLTPPAKQIEYELPSIPKNPFLGRPVGIGTMAIPVDYTKFLIEEKILSNTKTDIYMLDVDPKSLGLLDGASYSITTMPMNYFEAEPIKLPSYTFNEFIPRNKSLNEIYNKKNKFINDIAAKIAVSENSEYMYKNPRNSNANVKLDKAKPNNNFILIKPDTNDTFPEKFRIEIVNNTITNNQVITLWGDNILNKNKPQPDGNPNKILDPDTLLNYTENVSKTVFGYNKKGFGDSCFELDDSSCKIGDMEVGNRCINIIQSGDIYDEKNSKIGSVSKNPATQARNTQKKKDDIPTETLIINIDNKNVTGLLLYLSYLT